SQPVAEAVVTRAIRLTAAQEPLPQLPGPLREAAPRRGRLPSGEPGERRRVRQAQSHGHGLPAHPRPRAVLPVDGGPVRTIDGPPAPPPGEHSGPVGQHLRLRGRLEPQREALVHGPRGHEQPGPVSRAGPQALRGGDPGLGDGDHPAPPAESPSPAESSAHSIVDTTDFCRVGFSTDVAAPTYGSIVCSSFCGVARTRWNPNATNTSSAIRV